MHVSELQILQIRGGIEDSSKIIFLTSQGKHNCDTSLKLSRRDRSSEGSQYVFMEQLRKIIPILSQSPRLEGASTEDGSKIIFLISQQKHIYCDHLLKPSH